MTYEVVIITKGGQVAHRDELTPQVLCSVVRAMVRQGATVMVQPKEEDGHGN